MKILWRSMRRQSFFLRAAMLVGLEAVFLAAMAPFLWYFGPAACLAAAGLAAGLCMAGALLSLWIHYIFPDPKSVLISTLLGMAVNMGVPLAFGIFIHLYGGPLSEAGFLYYLVFFYLLTLAMKTMLTLPVPRITAAGK